MSFNGKELNVSFERESNNSVEGAREGGGAVGGTNRGAVEGANRGAVEGANRGAVVGGPRSLSRGANWTSSNILEAAIRTSPAVLQLRKLSESGEGGPAAAGGGGFISLAAPGGALPKLEESVVEKPDGMDKIPADYGDLEEEVFKDFPDILSLHSCNDFVKQSL